MRRPIVRSGLGIVAVLALFAARPAGASPPAGDPAEMNKDQQTLRAAGLDSSSTALLAFFRTRSQTTLDPQHLLGLVQRFNDTAGSEQAAAASELLAWGPLAVPALRRIANDLDGSPSAT